LGRHRAPGIRWRGNRPRRLVATICDREVGCGGIAERQPVLPKATGVQSASSHLIPGSEHPCLSSSENRASCSIPYAVTCPCRWLRRKPRLAEDTGLQRRVLSRRQLRGLRTSQPATLPARRRKREPILPRDIGIHLLLCYAMSLSNQIFAEHSCFFSPRRGQVRCPVKMCKRDNMNNLKNTRWK
jgi:hypothetical protein